MFSEMCNRVKTNFWNISVG